MKHKLPENINSHDIRIYVLTSGKTVIGEFLSEDVDGVCLSCALEIKKIQSADGQFADKMIPFISGNSSETATIYHHCIECMVSTSESVKLRYTESLIYDRLLTLMMSELLKDHEDLDSSSPELDKQDSFESDEELWNSFLDRWKNTDV